MKEIISEILKNDFLSIGHFHIYTYGLLIAMGLCFALALVPIRKKKYSKINDNYLWMLIYLLICVGFLGAKVFSLMTTLKVAISDGISAWLLSSGFVVYGGILTGVLCGYIYLKRHNQDFLYYADFLIPLIPLIQFFGRLGCSFAGCCYGKKTDASFAITYVYSKIAPLNTPLFPTQFVSAILNLILFIFLLIYEKYKKRYKGQLLYIYLILYSIGRFFIEFFRGDTIRGNWLWFSTSQWIAIFTLLIIFTLPKKEKFYENKK